MLDFTRFRLILLGVFLCSTLAFGFHVDSTFIKIPTTLIKNSTDHSDLRKQFKDWKIYKVDANSIFAQATAMPKPKLDLELGALDIHAEFSHVRLFGPNYHVNSTFAPHTGTRAFPLSSTLKDGEIRLTTNKDFLYGYVAQGNNKWYIEPLGYFIPDAPKDFFIVYSEQDVINDDLRTCGVADANRVKTQLTNHDAENVQTPNTNCYQVDLAIASDYAMYQKYSTIQGVENHNIGVINNVQGNYVGSFADDFILNIATQYIVTNSGGDPWTSSTDPFDLLPDFASWGQNGGFGVSYDVAELWSDRNFDGTTIGLAYIGVICTSGKYHVLQDFSNNAAYLRVLTAHEMGHNFSAIHDADGSSYIMAPTVSTSTTWSAESVNSVNNHTAPLVGNCLAATSCSGPSGEIPSVNFSATPTTICEGNTVQFTDLSTENPTSWEWAFPGGTPSTSTDQNPLITYNNAGVYSVTLIATNSTGGGQGTIQNYITVQGGPSFTVWADGLTANFTNTTTPDADSYEWDFGDPGSGANNTSTLVNPSHTYPQDGQYIITLTAHNSCGSSTYNLTLSINTPPVANFSATPTSTCTGDAIQFTSESSVNTIQWNWTFPGGTPSSSNEENPLVVYNSPGDFDVTLIAYSPAGSDPETKTNYIHITQAAIPDFSYSPSGNDITFTNLTSPLTGNGYLWYFGDSGTTSTDVHPVHTYPGPGTYTVTLDVITSSCGTRTITKTVEIIAPPVSNFTATPTSGCGPLTVQFTDISTGNPLVWLWTFPGGNPSTSSAQNPTVVYSSPGQYDVTLQVANAVDSNIKTYSNFITVNPSPTSSFTTTNTSPNTIAFTNTSTGSPTSYLWNFGDGTTSTEENPTHVFTTDGIYTISLTAINDCGSQTSSHDVTISGNAPTANIIVSPSNNICIGQTVNFTADVSANTQSVAWIFEGGSPATSTDNNPSVVFTTVGSHNVTLTAVNGPSSTNANTVITVQPNPISEFASGTDGLTANFTNTSTNVTSYSWDFGDGGVSSATNPSHTYLADGTYNVCLIVSGSCGIDTTCHEIVISGNGPSVAIESNITSGCQPLTINYHANISANTNSVEWTFGGGSPASSTLVNQSVLYNNPGVYLTTLVGSNPSGSSTANVQIIVSPTVNAAFSSNLDGPSVHFSDLSLGNPTSYLWDFGDGTTSTETNPTHIFANPGTYTVCLTASNSCGDNEICHSVVIPDFQPTAVITYEGSLTGCEPMAVNFTADVTNASSVAWTFEGGTPATSNLIHQSVVFSTPGTHTVTLSAINSYGTTVADEKSIVVLPKPIANFEVEVFGHQVNTTNNSQNAATYLWDFGDGTVNTGPNPSHLYNSDTVTTIILVATNSCGSDTTSHSATIGAAPSVAPTVSNSIGCAPFSVNFQAHAQNSTDIVWSFPTGTPSTSTDPNPTVIFNTVGSHTATVTANNSLNTATQSIEVVVLPETVSSFTYTIDNNKVTFSSTSQNVNSSLWIFGDGQSTANMTNTEHIYANGDYTAILIVTGPCGSDTSMVPLSFGATLPPTAVLEASANEGCVSLEVTYTAQVSNNTSNFSWKFPGGNPLTSDDTTVVVVYNSVGDYTASLIASNDYGTDTAKHQLIIRPSAEASYTFGVDNLTLTANNNSTNADTYLWTFGDGESSTLENPIHEYSSTGNYHITLRAYNSCSVDSTSKNLFIVNIDDPLNELDIKLYPNPSYGIYTLDVASFKADEIDIKIYDVLGRLVKAKHWAKTQKIHEDINIEDQPAGNYIFQLNYQGRILTGKLIKM